MHLDPRTLLFSLILTNILTVLSLFVAVHGQGRGQRNGMGKWAAAMALETLTWVLIAARGQVPDFVSVALANTLKASAHALILLAIAEFQGRALPRWQPILPVALTLAAATLLLDDLQSRFVWLGLIYTLQMLLVMRTLLADPETRSGRAWRLLFAGAAALVAVLALRAIVALAEPGALSQLDGTPHWVQLLAFVVLMATALLGSIGFILMVKERADREVMHLAMTDSLTQVPNRRALIDQAERTLARRGGQPVAVLMIDVDHFKRINDKHGHPVGDAVLRQIAALLMNRLRRHDIMGRYGGEEFCVVAPDADAENAHRLAEALRELVASTPLSTEQGELSVSISIGFTCCQANGEKPLDAVLAEADAALYAAKQAGRNRVARFQPQAPDTAEAGAAQPALAPAAL